MEGARAARGIRRLAGAVLLAMALGAPAAHAAGAPEVTATWATTVTASSANLNARIDPGGLSTTYRFEYVPTSSFLVNGFTGATKVPAAAAGVGSTGEAPVPVIQHVGGLPPGASYRYRVVASNTSGPVTGPTRSLQTDVLAPVFSLPDARGWELVSPLDKNGGQIAAPEALFGGNVPQAAAQGGAFAYGSAFSFGPSQGAPGASQYLSRRTSGGWSTENLTVPLVSGGYPTEPDSGVPYQLFSGDLASALISNGKRCRGEATACPVANPALPGSGAPAGYRDYYLRANTGGTFKALLGAADVAGLDPTELEVAFVGATPDLTQVVLSSCSALTGDATEVAGVGGECDPAAQNLYRFSAGGLSLINPLPGATLAAPSGAISTNGSRAYFASAGNLYLREGTQTKQVDETLGGGGSFQTASADGSVAYLTKAGHLYRYAAPGGTLTDLTPAGGVQGVLGASADGSHLYYLTAAGLFLWDQGTTTKVADAADASNYPPATGTARVSADGTSLAFLSSADLGDYESVGNVEVFLYSAVSDTLTCASCNPSGERPLGPSSIPGALANGEAIEIYKPRVLSADGSRLFFDSSDALVPEDHDGEPDVYQWEAQGTGSCGTPGGCVDLISSGRGGEGGYFLDASADGSDAFFLTAGSLVGEDPGAFDVYDARVGGGFPLPATVIPCVGDACQAIPGEVEDPTPVTSVVRADGNPPLRFPKAKKSHKKRHHKKDHHKKRHPRGRR